MVEIPTAVMSVPTAVTASTAVAGTASALNSVQVAVQEASQALADLTRSIQTSATVTAPPSLSTDGNSVTLSTSLGNLTVTLPLLSAAETQSLLLQLTALAQSGRPLTLGIGAGSPPTQAVLLLPTVPASPTQNTSTTLPASPLSLPLAPLEAGDILPALVLPSLASLSTSPASASIPSLTQASLSAPTVPATEETSSSVDLPAPASSLSLPIVVETSSQQLPSSPATAPSLSVPTLAFASPQEAAPVALALTSLLQAGNEVSLHVDVILPPSQNLQSLPPLATNQIAATVTGTGTDGQLILKADDTTLFVKAQATAPIGSTVIVTVGAGRTLPPITFPSIDPINFQALPQAMAALAQTDPQALMQMLALRMPQPNEALPGALLLLFGAFRQGNVRGWLGDDAVETLLHAGKTDIVNSLMRELGEAGQSAQDDVVGDWKSYPIPLYAQQQFQALTLYVHNDRHAREEGGGTASGTGKVRFLIDMTLSKLGSMQIDGFVQPKKLDMILRSEHTLPPGLHTDLRSAYIKAVGAVGYAGSLHFQVGRQHWLTMQRTPQPGILT
jgi:hypothetical protein